MRWFCVTALLLLCLGIFSPEIAQAEDGCAGPTYLQPDCSDDCGTQYCHCAQAACHDVSFSQDGSLFQCCPPSAGVPELPEWINPFYLALFISLGFLFWQDRRRVRSYSRLS